MYTAFNASGRQLENSPPIVGIQRDFIFAMTLKITKCKRLHFIFRSDGDFFFGLFVKRLFGIGQKADRVCRLLLFIYYALYLLSPTSRS